MRAVVQRVSSASVTIDGKLRAEIGEGLLVFVAAGKNDSSASAEWMADRVAKMRIFNDEAGKLNLSVGDVGGSVLAISNFTLYGDAVGNRRPSFMCAAGFEDGKIAFDAFVQSLRKLVSNVQTGEFGADMKITLTNDGPVTIIVDSP